MAKGKPDSETRFCTMRREGNRLIPVSAYDSEILSAFDQGVDIEVTFKVRRNSKRLQAYWAWLHEINEAIEAYPNVERFHDAIKWACGYTTTIILLDGTIQTVVDSVAFSKMDETEFKGFFQRAQRLVNERYLR
jgi:hypothetical protein